MSNDFHGHFYPNHSSFIHLCIATRFGQSYGIQNYVPLIKDFCYGENNIS